MAAMTLAQAQQLARQIAAEDALFADAHPWQDVDGTAYVELNPVFDSPQEDRGTYSRRVLVATPEDWTEWRGILFAQRDRTAGHRDNWKS